MRRRLLCAACGLDARHPACVSAVEKTPSFSFCQVDIYGIKTYYDSRSDRSDHIYHETGVENHSSANSGQEPIHKCRGLRLFADDCILYTPIRTQNDSSLLQNDLHKLQKWQDTWL